jgi:hypothetical protein
MKEIRKQKIKREKKDRSKKRTTAHLGRARSRSPLTCPNRYAFFFFFPELTGGAPCQYHLPRVDLAQRPSPPSSV